MTSHEPRPGALLGSLDPAAVRTGRPRGPHGLYQRRARPRVFGEPLYEVELVPAQVEPARPHVVAYDAWQRMVGAAAEDGLATNRLLIHSAYRSVAYQAEIFAFRLEERRRTRRQAGLPDLPEHELRRQQRRFTAEPGHSAHHTGLAIDLSLYTLGTAACRRTREYAWLARNAVRFGFYPYLPEGWHWEYDPPGLVEQIRELRRRIASGEPFGELLVSPEQIPIAPPGR